MKYLPPYYLIRHGEIHNPQGLFYGRSVDVELNAVGRKQMEQLGRAIKQRGSQPEVLITSPMKRTVQSSEILSGVLDDIPIVPSDDLLEVASSGFEGWDIQRLLELEDYLNNPPDGVTIESITQVAYRMRRVIRMASQYYEGKSIGFVSHGDPIAIAQWSLLHPDMSSVSSKEIIQFSAAKGEAWKIQLHTDGRLADYELVRGESIYQRKERR